jgi:hypothetical protein
VCAVEVWYRLYTIPPQHAHDNTTGIYIVTVYMLPTLTAPTSR